MKQRAKFTHGAAKFFKGNDASLNQFLANITNHRKENPTRKTILMYVSNSNGAENVYAFFVEKDNEYTIVLETEYREICEKENSAL